MNKALLYALAGVLCLASCKKTSNGNASGSQIVLQAPKVSGNLVTLNWSKLNNDSLQYYTLMRVTDTTNQLSTTYFTVDKNTTQYIDTLPLAPYVQYYVVADLSSAIASVVTSNTETYTRTDIAFAALSPMDAIFDRANQQLFIYSSAGQIAVYNVQSKKYTNQVATNATIGYCDIGTYNGAEELYVPRSDGWLFIYNASTLAQIDQINVGGQLIGVVNNNGILYLCSFGNINVISYNRATKAQIAVAPIENASRLKLIPNTNSQLLSICGSNEIYRLLFTSTGGYVSFKWLSLPPSPIYPSIVELFPGGTEFISSSSGSIYDTSLAYVATLPHGNVSYTSFDFDATDQLIYAGCTTKTILSYSMSTYILGNTINTQGYPAKVFYNNGTVLSVSTSFEPQPYAGSTATVYTFVEQLQ